MKKYEDYTNQANLEIFGTENPVVPSYKHVHYGYLEGKAYGPFVTRNELDLLDIKISLKERVCINTEEVKDFNKKARESSLLADRYYFNDHRLEYKDLSDDVYIEIRSQSREKIDEFDNFKEAFEHYLEFYKRVMKE